MSHSDNSKNPHQQVWELLPWIINGRASEQERNMVLEHVRNCADCRAEFELQSRLSAALMADTTSRPDPAAGFARLLNRIDHVADSAPQHAHKTTARSARKRKSWLTYGLAALVILQTGALAIVGAQLFAQSQAAQSVAPYQTLSSPEPAAQHATIRIVPAPSLSVAELNAVLLQNQLQIISGPSEAGVFSLAPTSVQPRVAEQLAHLRATLGIRFAEPVGAP